MPLRSTATARQERLGIELRRMREAAGITARETAKLLGTDPGKVSHIESGRLGVSEERLRRLAAFYSCVDSDLIDALAAITYEQRGQGWWEEYRGVVSLRLLDLAELEYRSTGLSHFEVLHIPGLLQTEESALAIFAYAVPELPTPDVESRLAFRMHRQKALDRDPSLPYEVIIHEAALRTKVGTTAIARAQLHHILTASERPNVTLRVVPFKVEGFGGTGFSMLYANGPVPQLDTVQIDAAHDCVFVNNHPQLAKYRLVLDKIRSASLPPGRSRDLIRQVARDL
ncbi:helix-turn-helix domain-containing protein [Streptomyces albireticuli]|uniref:Transcriptional regulator n=1 Tax=Streptomyces albireticuli TaxID=1940 RepID=A0A2A2DF19_9ACTN|nr:helix-turn-helix transcriptional regulator [Streptomyces albireticuli]MCD9142798.1 helix-turn-helix domain-containing protein [Streptomyces albireticuli]PAU50124.1 transcriptional regulator [Streptomyces albireticuli]